MTKPVAPLTYGTALARIEALIGLDAMAKATGRKPGYVRKWGDPDAKRSCPIICAEALDLAYQAAGGVGAPMCETMAARLTSRMAEQFADQARLTHVTEAIVREFGPAAGALIAASRPGASQGDREAALREVELLGTELKETLPLLTKGAGPVGATGEGIGGNP